MKCLPKIFSLGTYLFIRESSVFKSKFLKSHLFLLAVYVSGPKSYYFSIESDNI